MPATAFVICFPNGDYEYDVSQRTVPSIGETLRRNRVLWSVTRLTNGLVPTVYVERADARGARESAIALATRSR